MESTALALETLVIAAAAGSLKARVDLETLACRAATPAKRAIVKHLAALLPVAPPVREMLRRVGHE